MSSQDSVNTLISHLFRHESGKMVSVLTRMLGIENIELAEDIVQETMIKAMEDWKYNRIPENPAAWLYTVAKNKSIDIIRRNKHLNKIKSDLSYLLESEWTINPTVNTLFLENEIEDSQLRMIFTCTHPELSPESQIALTLKTLCGFSIPEIARAFLTSEQTINKRLYRAKQKMRNGEIKLEVPVGEELKKRLNIVHKTIYLLFNEGYNSLSDDTVIRKDVCSEAMRLCKILVEKEGICNLDTYALMALMCFNAARFEARISIDNDIVLLEYQDRGLWNQELINYGMQYLDKSLEDGYYSEYHLEAGITGYHSTAKNFEETNWIKIIQLYDLLIHIKKSPVLELNRAIALAQVYGPKKAIEEIQAIQGIEEYYLYHSVLGDLYLKNLDYKLAESHLKKAIDLTKSKPEQKLIEEKLSKLQ